MLNLQLDTGVNSSTAVGAQRCNELQGMSLSRTAINYKTSGLVLSSPADPRAARCNAYAKCICIQASRAVQFTPDQGWITLD
jgi:hypothetical protein